MIGWTTEDTLITCHMLTYQLHIVLSNAVNINRYEDGSKKSMYGTHF